jgi:hypothetical protein
MLGAQVTNLDPFLTNQPTKECHLFTPKVVVVDLFLSCKSSFPWAKAEFASFFLGKTNGEQKRRTTFFIILQPIRACHSSCLFWGQVSINEGYIGVNTTHINPMLTRLSPKDRIRHVGLELVMASTPKGMAGVFGQDQPYLII